MYMVSLMEKKLRIGIVDTLSLSANNKIYGHFNKTASDYYNILSKVGDVYIVGGETYAAHFDKNKLIRLPFYTTKKEFDSRDVFVRLICKAKSIINTAFAYLLPLDILIFQDANQTAIYKLSKYSGKKRVFIVKYAIENREAVRNAFWKNSKHFDGVITSIKSVAEYYQKPYVLIPDYFPMETAQASDCIKKWDVSVVGTVMGFKDYEAVVEALSNTEFKVYIAGYFPDKERLSMIKSMSSDNIVIEDKYLSEEEYDCAIRSSRYVLLPYKAEGYAEKSSGVVLDAIYRGVPVITPDYESFSFVKEEKLGYCYTGGLSKTNLLPLLSKDANAVGVQEFIMKQKEKAKVFADFVVNAEVS